VPPAGPEDDEVLGEHNEDQEHVVEPALELDGKQLTDDERGRLQALPGHRPGRCDLYGGSPVSAYGHPPRVVVVNHVGADCKVTGLVRVLDRDALQFDLQVVKPPAQGGSAALLPHPCSPPHALVADFQRPCDLDTRASLL
jgi:hypothetical protein